MTRVTSAIPCAGPLLRSGPDDVLGLARTERPALLAERPAQRVGQVALARAVRPDDRADPAPELDGGPLGERLEAMQPQGQQARLGDPRRPLRAQERRRSSLTGPSGSIVVRRRSIACDAAAVSAVRRDGPSPTPSSWPSTQTSIRNDFSWSGPGRVEQPVRRPLARVPLGVLLEPALGALQGADRQLGGELGSASPTSQSRTGAKPEVEVERAGDGLERARRGATGGAGRSAGPRPRRAGGTPPRSIRPASRASPTVDTIAARRADR